MLHNYYIIFFQMGKEKVKRGEMKMVAKKKPAAKKTTAKPKAKAKKK